MRLTIGFKAFDKEEERENIGFHDHPQGSLQGETLEVLDAHYQAGLSNDRESPNVSQKIANQLGMQLKVVDQATYSRTVGPGDSFLVMPDANDLNGEPPKVWFGYWDASGCQFLRERGSVFPYRWVSPQILDTYERVVRPGAEPGIIAESPDAARMLGCDVDAGQVWPPPSQD